MERINEAKRYAAFIKRGVGITSLEDAEMVLKCVISRHYKIPIFSEYFDKRTIDQLFFEVEFILENDKPSAESISDTIKENKPEIDSIADEMDQWNDMSASAEDASVENDPIFQMAREFMKTGKFANEKQQFEPNTQQPEVDQTDNSEDTSNDWQRTSMD